MRWLALTLALLVGPAARTAVAQDVCVGVVLVIDAPTEAALNPDEAACLAALRLIPGGAAFVHAALPAGCTPTRQTPCDFIQTVVTAAVLAGTAEEAETGAEPLETSPVAPDTQAGQGSGAQTLAAPSVLPTPAGGITASYANAADTSYLVFAGAINPVALLVSPADRMWAERFMDFSAVVPVRLEDASTMAIAGVDSGGVRTRVNFLALDPRYLSFDRDVRAHVAELQATQTAFDEALRLTVEALRADPAALRQCLVSVGFRAPVEACGAQREALARSTADIDADRSALETEVERRRQELDMWYAGLDLRYDHGDPALTGLVPINSDTLLFAASGGLQYQSDAFMFSGRVRLGYRGYWAIQTESHNFDLAGAIDVGFVIDRRAYRLSAGVEARLGSESLMGTVTANQRGEARFGLVVPMGGIVAATVGVAIPFGTGIATNAVFTAGVELRGDELD